MPLLETERLLLPPLSADEVDCLYRISNKPNVRLYLWDNETVSEETIEGFVAQSDRMFSEVKIGVFGVRMRGREDYSAFAASSGSKAWKSRSPGTS